MDDAEVGQSIRLGDLYSIVIIHNVKTSNFKKVLEWKATADFTVPIIISFESFGNYHLITPMVREIVRHLSPSGVTLLMRSKQQVLAFLGARAGGTPS